MNTVNISQERTTISLSKDNYEKLSRLGFAGESFNDVIGRLITLQLQANKHEEQED